MRRAEVHEQLRERREHLAPLLEISPSATIITDVDSNVVAWNPAAELFGYTSEEALGRTLDYLAASDEQMVVFGAPHRAKEAARAWSARPALAWEIVELVDRTAG